MADYREMGTQIPETNRKPPGILRILQRIGREFGLLRGLQRSPIE